MCSYRNERFFRPHSVRLPSTSTQPFFMNIFSETRFACCYCYYCWLFLSLFCLPLSLLAIVYVLLVRQRERDFDWTLTSSAVARLYDKHSHTQWLSSSSQSITVKGRCKGLLSLPILCQNGHWRGNRALTVPLGREATLLTGVEFPSKKIITASGCADSQSILPSSFSSSCVFDSSR